MKVEPTPVTSSRGWFKAMRGDDAIEMIRTNPNAFILAYVMAHRARWREGFNEHGLGQGESFLGDYESYGMTQQNYRTAKAQLEKWNFATFKPTNKGTLGKLIDTRLFSTAVDEANEQNNEQPTSSQRTGNERVTTNEEGKKVKNEKKVASLPAFEIPESLKGEDFEQAWQDWCSDRLERKKPITARAAKVQLEKLAGMGKAKAIASIKESIANGWQGLFEPKGASSKTGSSIAPGLTLDNRGGSL